MLLPATADVDLAAPLAHFAEHGWARLGRALDDDGLAALRARADELMLGQRVIDGLFFQPDSATGSYDDLEFGRGYVGPSLAYRKIEKLEKDDLYAAWIGNAFFERVARTLIAGDIAIYRACLFIKAASGGTHLGWHQDGGRFWGIDQLPTLQIWTALDDCPVESGCVEVLSGTHHAGLATPGGGNVPAAMVAAADAEARALPLPARAGEVLLIHNHLWHRSGRNSTGRPRRALTICYMSATARCLRKKHAPRQFHRPFAPRP